MDGNGGNGSGRRTRRTERIGRAARSVLFTGPQSGGEMMKSGVVRMVAVCALALALLPALSDSPVSGQTRGKVRITVDGSTTVGPIAKAFAEYYMEQHPDVDISVSEFGSGNGAKGLINGTCDVADMSRFMKDKEFAAAVEKGVMPVAHVVAMDGLPIIVHPSNPVSELTVAQVRGIFSGKITNWRQVGGPNLRIVKISRDTNSGTYETFGKLVMAKEKISADTEYVGSNGAVRAGVQTTPAAVGYAGLGFVDDTVKALRIDGIYPDRATGETRVTSERLETRNAHDHLARKGEASVDRAMTGYA